MSKPLKKCAHCSRQYMQESDFLVDTNRWRVCDDGHLWFNCGCGSTLVIPKGKFDWYSPDMTMGADAKALFNRLPQMGDMPHIPTTVMELQQLLSDPNVSAGKLASTAKKDPLLAGNLLTIANNLKSSTGNRIESLEHAISYVGMNTLKDLAVTAALRSFKFETSSFNSEKFWDHAFLTGRIAEHLAKEFCKGYIIPDEAYLAGTLCNIGKVVMAISFPEMADSIAKDLANPKNTGPWRDIEKKNKAYDHRTLGEIGCTLWGLPPYVVEVNQSHHSPPESSKDGPVMDDIVGLANQLAHWINLEPHRMDDDLTEAYCRKFGIPKPKLEEIADQLMSLRSA